MNRTGDGPEQSHQRLPDVEAELEGFVAASDQERRDLVSRLAAQELTLTEWQKAELRTRLLDRFIDGSAADIEAALRKGGIDRPRQMAEDMVAGIGERLRMPDVDRGGLPLLGSLSIHQLYAAVFGARDRALAELGLGSAGGGLSRKARPSRATAAGILLVVVGILTALFGVVALVSYLAYLSRTSYPSGIFFEGRPYALLLFFGLLLMPGAGIVQFLGGVLILRSRRLGRRLGFVGSVMGVAVGVLALTSAALEPGAEEFFVGVVLVIGICMLPYVAIVVLLARNTRSFA